MSLHGERSQLLAWSNTALLRWSTEERKHSTLAWLNSTGLSHTRCSRRYLGGAPHFFHTLSWEEEISSFHRTAWYLCPSKTMLACAVLEKKNPILQPRIKENDERGRKNQLQGIKHHPTRTQWSIVYIGHLEQSICIWSKALTLRHSQSIDKEWEKEPRRTCAMTSSAHALYIFLGTGHAPHMHVSI